VSNEIIVSDIDRFKADLSNSSLSHNEIVDRHILFGTPYIFKAEEDKYYSLKRVIASEFDVSTSNVVMVGSAKLGYSIAPKKLWRPIQENSDIDMVIISDQLFDSFWKQLLDFNINLTYRTEKDQEMYNEFLEYFFKGWLRPDKFPFKYPSKQKWFDFFSSISYKEYDKRKVTGAIYRSEHFFKLYHEINIKKLRSGGR
jgi:hypothetical protein